MKVYCVWEQQEGDRLKLVAIYQNIDEAWNAVFNLILKHRVPFTMTTEAVLS